MNRDYRPMHWYSRRKKSIWDWYRGLHRETRIVLWGAAAVTLVFGIIVLLQGIRLGHAKKELKSVQAASQSLQEELELLKAEQKKIDIEKTEVEKTEVSNGGNSTKEPEPTAAPTMTPEPRKYIVCVDAGHGDWDGGAVLRENGVEKRIEKNDTLWLASLFRDELSQYGVEVVMTRETDVFIELSERTAIANRVGADALISFHRNSIEGNSEVHGVEFWIHSSRPADAETLAGRMLDAVISVGGMTSRGVKSGAQSGTRDNYSINQKANMTSMIAEFGFITSPADNEAYDQYGAEYARQMARVVYEWLVEREAGQE